MFFLTVASVWLASPAEAQFNRYGGGGNYGGGYNSYGGGGSYGGGYGGSRYGGSSYGGSSYGGSSYGGSSYGGGYGNSRYGGSSYGGGYGNSRYGGSSNGGGYGSYGGGMSGRSGRSSRRGGGNSAYGNSGYGNYGGGYNQQQYGGNTRGRGRSSRNSQYGQYGGQVPNTAASQGQANQTTPSGNSSDRRSALSGKSSVRGAVSGAAGGAASAGGLTIQGAAGQGGRPASNAKGRPAARKNQPEQKMKPTATLYMESASQMAVVNQPKLVSVVLSNKKIEYDTLSFRLQFDPDDLKPISGQDASGEWISADTISVQNEAGSSQSDSPDEGEGSFIAANPSRYEIVSNTIDAEKGEINFTVKVKNGNSDEGGEVVRLTFLPLRESQTTISFVFNELSGTNEESKPLTALTLSEADQLGSRFNKADGVINLDLQIYQTLEKVRDRMVVKKAGDKGLDESEESSYNTTLSLVPHEYDIEVGSIVEVDVVINNPNKEVFDTVNLLVAYNPRVFEALDGDDFAEGINIEDQPYKERFPLDFPILNEIDSERGIIDYRKKSMRTPAREEGVLATIKLRALRPTKKTTFRLFINQTGEEPTTGLFYRNSDRLGDPLDMYDGVNTCSIGVRPTTAYLKKFR